MSVEKIPELIGQIDDEQGKPARELVRLVLELHGQALLAMLEKIRDDALVARIAADPRVHGVLLLHGLHPEPAEARVRAALRRFSSLSLVEVSLDGGEMRLRVTHQGSLKPGEKLRERVEEAVLAAAPELTGLRIEGLPAEKAFIPIHAG